MGLEFERRFTALRVIGTIFKVLAWITLVVGILATAAVVAASLLGSGPLTDWLPGWDLGLGSVILAAIGGVVILVVFLIYFLLLYAAGDTVYLFLSIEDNTRHMAYLLAQQARSLRAYGPGLPPDLLPPAEDT